MIGGGWKEEDHSEGGQAELGPMLKSTECRGLIIDAWMFWGRVYSSGVV